jgi:hypothetical protein
MLNETILIINILDNDKMSSKISVLIRKNSHEVMKVITNNYKKLQSDSRYCQYNNEGTDEMILPLFPTYLCYCELLWKHFSPPHEEVARKLEEHPRTLHHTPTQYLCIHYSKINAPFSQNFSLNHRINT